MVYNFSTRLLNTLQFNCLVCGLRCKDDSSDIFGLCQYCHASLPHLHAEQCCVRCFLPLPANSQTRLCGRCLKKPPAFDGSCCALSYEGLTQTLIQRLKRQFDHANNRLLAQLLARQIQRQTDLPPPQVIIPSPMFWRRNLKRGNNHSLLLSQHLSKCLKIPINNRLLRRSKYSRTQRGLSAKARRENIKGIFEVVGDVEGQHISICDDVMTTGATMHEISFTLKQAGAAKVTAWSVARTPFSLK
ncbi:MAG: ComF family protein [Pseudomonadales bacterium]|nr:ComF family protein [Pseudomonadales bacterium]